MSPNIKKSTDASVWAQNFVSQHGGDMKLMEEWFKQALDTGWRSGRNTAAENNAKHLFYLSHGHGQY